MEFQKTGSIMAEIAVISTDVDNEPLKNASGLEREVSHLKFPIP